MAKLAIAPNLLAIRDEARSIAIILDSASGRYWRITGLPLQVLTGIAADDESAGIEAQASDLADHAIARLQSSRILVTTNSFRPESSSPRRPSIAKRGAARPWLPILVVEYALRNTAYRALLRVFGWRPVAGRIETQRYSGQESVSLSDWPECVADIGAAVRFASLLPWVRRSCIPHSLALYDIVLRMGVRPHLRIGATVVPFEPHMWIEAGGLRLDSWAEDDSLDVFKPLRESLQ